MGRPVRTSAANSALLARGLRAVGMDEEHLAPFPGQPESGDAVAAARTPEDDLLALGLADHALRPFGAEGEFHHLAQLSRGP